jgi:sec-independent protein translocase protein TatA
MNFTPLLALGMPGPFEMLLIAGVGLLLFGRRLPDVGKGLARSIVEFKKGLREVTDEIDTAGTTPGTTAGTTAGKPNNSSTSNN